MSPLEKFLLGGAGALIPVLLTIGVSDVAKINEYLGGEVWDLLGYACRALALFLMGAVWVYIDSSVVTRRKAVEIGLVGPALISAWLNASNLDYVRNSNQQAALVLPFISEAQAQEEPREPRPDSRSILEQFIKGFLGR